MAAAPKVVSSPLYKVIDAVQWDAEGLLGRLIVLVHAAFVDAGFVSLPLLPGRDGPIPREAGRVASTLSLRYTVPQLLHRPEDVDPAAVLRHEVYERKMFFYVQCDGRPVASSWWVRADAVSFLSDDLDATARALRRDTRLAALWRGLSDNLCARALVYLCQFYGVALEPTFLSLPDDVQLAILTRLTDGADLARVECTCTALSRLAADRGLWKTLYNALHYAWRYPIAGGLLETTSWKVRYARSRRWQLVQKMLSMRASSWWRTFVPSHHYPTLDSFSVVMVPCRHDERPKLPADLIPDPRKLRSAAARSRRHERRGQMSCGGQGKRRHGAGAIHAPSSRYRWNHR